MDTHLFVKDMIAAQWKILVIDDDPDDFFLVKEMLKISKGRSFDISWASTYEVGQQELSLERYDAVLVDYDLGPKSGIELIREANERGYTAPLILFTGRGSYEVDVEAMEAGATLYLTKSEANPLLLERAIRYAIELKKKEQLLRQSEANLQDLIEQLQQSEARERTKVAELNAVLDAVPAIVWITHDLQAQEVVGNQAAHDFLRVPPGKNLSKSAQVDAPRNFRVYQDDRELAPEELPLQITAATGKHIRNFEEEVVFEDGAQTYLLGNVTPLLNDDGGPYGAVGAFINITERKQAEKALKKAEERFAKAFYSSPASLAITRTSDGRYIEANESLCQVTGYHRDEIIGHTAHELGIYANPQQRAELIALLNEQGTVRNYEIAVRAKSGVIRTLLGSFDLIELENEPCMLATLIDFTERKLVEEALRASEDRFSKAFNANPNAQVISRIDDGRIEIINDSFVQLFGYQREEALGKTSMELHMFAQPTQREEAVRRIQTDQFIRDYELDIQTKSGEVRRASLSVELVVIGSDTLMLTIIQDITDRKQTEQALRESERRLRDFVENTRNNYIALDRGWRFTYANRNYGEVMGVNPEDLIGKNYWELFPQYLGTELEQNYRKVMEEGTPLQYRQGGVYTASQYDVSVYPTREGLAIFSIDRTEEIRHQLQLENERSRLETVLGSLPVGVWITDAEGRIVEKNPQADRIWAGDAPLVEGVEQYHQYQSWDAQTGKPMETEDFPLTRVLQTGELVPPEEHRIRRFDGSDGFVLVSARPIYDSEGRLEGAVAINLDITGQRQLQEENRQQKDLLERLVQTAPVGIAFLTGPQHIYRLVNDAYREGIGRTKGELVGHSVAEKWPEIADTVVPQLDSVYQTGEPFSVVDAPLTISRNRIPEEDYITYTFTPIYKADGRIEGVMIMVIETTLAVRDRLALQTQTARLESVLEALPVGIWFADQTGKLLFKNEYVDRIWGGDAPLSDSVERYQDYVAWFWDSGKRVSAEEFPIAQSLKTGRLGQPAELRIRRFDGSEGAVLAVGAPIIDPEGRLAGAVAINLDITERKQAEALLQQSLAQAEEGRAMLEALLDYVPEGIAIAYGQEVNIRMISRYGKDLLGWLDEAQTAGQLAEALKVYYPDGVTPMPEEELPLIRAIRRGEVVQNQEIIEVSASGKPIPLSCNAGPIRDSSGAIVGGIVAFRDITELKEAEQALKKREQEHRELAEALEVERAKLAAVIANLPIGVCIGDTQGNILSMNHVALSLHEFSDEAEMFLRVENYLQDFQLCYLDGRPISVEDWPSSHALGGVFVRNFEVILRNLHNRVERVIAYSAVPVRDNDGQVLLIIYVLEDLTDRKQAETALRASEAHFRHLADAMPQLVWTALPDGTVDYYNSRYQEYDGILPTQQGQWEWSPVLHPDDIEPTTIAWSEAVRTGGVYQIEHRVRMADGAFSWHLSRGVPRKDPSGKVNRWYGTATDIEDQKQIEAKLRQSNQELEEFAFIASHDLQEPLRKIILFGKSLRDHVCHTSDSQASDYLDRMQNAAERMQTMIQGLLELSRVKTRGSEFAPVNLNQVVAEVLSDLEPLIRSVQGQVITDSLPTIQGDALQIRQLFQNLIGNALKFHKPDISPIVQISGKIMKTQKPAAVEVRVTDNGIGFEQQYAERIFQPFQRLHGRSKFEGTGLGLAICHRIIERHHGSVTVESTPEVGSTFTIYLPVKPV